MPHIAFDSVVFNRIVCMDIMFLEGKSVLHVVEKDTKFSAPAFLQSEDHRRNPGNIYAYMGFCVYWLPDTIATDQGTQFQSQRWRTLLPMAGIEHKSSGVQSHNALGVGERCHSFLRQNYRKVRHAKPIIIKRTHACNQGYE